MNADQLKMAADWCRKYLPRGERTIGVAAAGNYGIEIQLCPNKSGCHWVPGMTSDAQGDFVHHLSQITPLVRIAVLVEIDRSDPQPESDPTRGEGCGAVQGPQAV